MARAATGGRLTCESCVAIDVREWKRRGFLRQHVPILWTACYLGGRRAWFRCTAYSLSPRPDVSGVLEPFR